MSARPSGGIHDDLDVVAALREAPEAEVTSRQPRSAFVERQDAADALEPGEDRLEARNLAHEVEVRDEAGDVDDVERPVAAQRPGDFHVAAARVVDGGCRHDAEDSVPTVRCQGASLERRRRREG